MSLRAMLLKYNTTMSPARHYTRAEQEAIRNRETRIQSLQLLQPQSEPTQVDAETVAPFPAAFYTTLNLVLSHGAAQNIGPTRCARLNYLWFVTTAMAYQWTQPANEARITGTKDRWNWNEGAPLETNKDQYVWMIHMWEALMPSFVPSFVPGTLLALERTALHWTVEQQEAEWTRIQDVGNWNGFLAAWNAWWTLRQADGSTEAAVQPTVEQLPNGETVLDTSDTVDPATFTQPTKWTPLKIGTRIQKYLTWSWMSVRSTVLSGEDGTIAQNAAKATFLTDPAAKAAEISEVLTISQNLTDTQKVSAEFWAGGPNTASPPGMMIWFWRVFMQSRTPTWSQLVYSGLDLAAHIFETARLVWGLKKHFMEARPIQFIRQQYRGTPITLYDGTATTGEHWMPYQETNFVTPPFADFPSGHSAFSQSFANVMTAWFGPEIPAIPYTATDLTLLSPSLATASQNLVLGTWTFPARSSQIQVDQVPSAPITVSFTTWQELADDAGLSRKLGGIHATSAHVGSQALANVLHQRMNMRWGIPRM
jgi:hypothetical protein